MHGYIDFVNIYYLFSAGDLTTCSEDEATGSNQPNMDDCVGCENQDEEAEAMIEEPPSGMKMFLIT